MSTVSSFLAAAVALLHVGFLVLEMFLWRTPWAQRVLRRSAEEQAQTAVMAKNQGLYNGFLAAGLSWSLVAPAPLAQPLRLFFCGCVVVAGVYGGATASRSILLLQALPGALALAAALM